MFAVIKTGGKQYRVAAEDRLTVERVAGAAGDIVTFSNVLMLVRDGKSEIGAPAVAGASVAAEILEQARGPKVIAFKKRRRKNSRRKRGHRQDLTVVRITEILADGAKPKAAAKPQAAPKPAEAPTAEAAPAATAAVGLAAAGEAGGKPARDSSNLSLISGVGPAMEKKLREAGILTWEQIAAWTAEDLAKWDKELALRGRAAREEWVEQAKELLAGKPPRAKVDKAEQKSGEDW